MQVEVQARMRPLHRLRWIVLVALLCAVQAKAQLTVGDNLSMNLNGSLGYGYSARFGDTASGHGQNLVGSGALTGSYYNPGFLSFSVRPYWDRNQNNSESGMIAHDNGIDSSVTLFSGSNFPTSFSFGKSFGSTSQFGLPGGAGVFTEGSGQNFGIGWSESVPGLPPVYASFSTSSSSFSALGAEGENHNFNKNFNLGTSYQIRGFNLSGNFNHGTSNYRYSDLLGFDTSGSSSSNSFSAGAQHGLPLHGSASLSWGHSSYATESSERNTGSTNTLGLTSGFLPWSRLSVSGQAQYTTNLTAAISHTLLADGVILPINNDSDSHALSVGSSASLDVGHGLSINGTVNRTSVAFLGRDSANTQFTGSLNYNFSHAFLDLFRFSVGVVDLANNSGNTGLGMVGNVAMGKKFGHWDTAADFSYSQQVRTLYGLATASNYSYGSSLRRKINRTTYWGATFRAAHTGLGQKPGAGSGSESFSSSLSWRRYSVAGSYSQSQGTSVLTPSGILAPTPVVGLITNDILLVNGRSMSFSGSTRLFRRVNFSGAYSMARSSMESSTANTLNQSHAFNVRMDYRLRKMTLVGGYTRVNQDASVLKSGPYVVNSFYLSFSRWFNVF